MKDNPKHTLIMQAAAECFSRFGFDKTTLDDIGRRAGLNKASLYYYFKNKEDIFVAVVAGEMQKHIADMQAKALAFPDVRRQIRHFLTERIRRYAEVIYLTRLSVENMDKLGPMFEAVSQETKTKEIAFLTLLLKKGVADNVFNFPMSSADMAETLFFLSEALKHETLRSSGRFVGQAPDFAETVAHFEKILQLILR
jgi:AcrR family transcriptional regulator